MNLGSERVFHLISASVYLGLRFIQYCELQQGYTGFDYKDADGEEDLVSRLASLKITSDGT